MPFVAVVVFGGLAAYLLTTGGGATPAAEQLRASSGRPEAPRIDSPQLVSAEARRAATSEGEVPPTAPERGPTPAGSPLTIESLVADVRREVEPGFWDHTPGATLEAKNGILIVRATSDVLDAVGSKLDALRTPGGAEPEQEPGDPVAAEELRALMRRMVDLHFRLDSAAHLLSADPDAALRLLDEVEGTEPDNAGVKAIRHQAASAQGERAGGLPMPPRMGRLGDWLLCWPSAATHQRLSELREEAGPAGELKLGLERDELLKRGSLTVAFESVPLWVAIRRVQVEALADITLAPGLAAELETQIVSLDVVARSLEVVLDALARNCPRGTAGCRPGVPSRLLGAGTRSHRVFASGTSM